MMNYVNKTLTQKITEEEVRKVVGTLKRLEPGFLPLPIFHAVARLVVMPIIDVVPVREGPNGSVEVLLTKRGSNDSYWPDMWHNPGTVVRASDTREDYADAFARIFIDALGMTNAPDTHFVASMLHHTKRGGESTQIYWVELTEQPKDGTFFDASQLPKNIIESNVQIIQTAVQAFQEAKLK